MGMLGLCREPDMNISGFAISIASGDKSSRPEKFNENLKQITG